MRAKLGWLIALLAAALTSSLLMVTMQVSAWLTGAGIMLSVLSLIAILQQVLRWISHLRSDIHKSLHIKGAALPWWHWGQIAGLANDYRDIIKKFDATVSMVSNISRKDIESSSTALEPTDPVAIAIQRVKNELVALKEAEGKRTWIANGLAEFGAILRNKSDLQTYAQQIISKLVRYLDANQGALFVAHTDSSGRNYLELAGCYAYEKKKHVNMRVDEGQGLLGQCMLERDLIFITDIPANYVKITSGLGLATPRNVAIAPLLFNEQFYGAIELASFTVLQPHHIQFLRDICESVAAEIASIKTIETTQALLAESNVLASELKDKEEATRQHIEALASAQEEMARKQVELTGMINAIDSTLGTIELDDQGRVIRCNRNIEALFDFPAAADLAGFGVSLIVGRATFSWQNVMEGSLHSGEFQTTTLQGRSIWVFVTFTRMFNATGTLERVLCLVQDVTLRKQTEQEFELLSLVADNTDNAVIITNEKGFIEYVNDGFTKMTGYQPHEAIRKKPGRLLQGPLTDQHVVKKLSRLLREESSIYEEILNYRKDGSTYWVSLAINPVKDTAGKVVRYIYPYKQI